MKIEWSDAVKLMMGNLVKIQTYGDGYGSGFVVPPPSNAAGSCCVMTAFHVIKKAHETGATISIQLADGSGAIELPSLLRTVFTVKDKDQALIIFNGPKNFGALKSLTFVSPEKHYNAGVELGWLGFPGLEVSVNVPCFLSGHISAYLQDKEAYLIDGVSIHGVSGGPVFYRDDNGNVIIAGIVTNYYPNPVQNQSWPGLAMFRAVAPLLRLYEAQSRTSIQALPELSVGGVSVVDPSKASAVP